MRENAISLSALCLLTFAGVVLAFFRLPCAVPIVIERTDPIVSSGKVSSHVHSVMGGNGFGFQMDYAATQASTCSSCTVVQDKSNYWVPTIYYRHQNGSFTAINQTGGATIYYLQRTDQKDPDYPSLVAFPEGFRMIAGNPNLRSYTDTAEQKVITFSCLGTKHAETKGFPNYNCPNGLRAQVFFPSCWNGRDVDSPDHKSHMAYPSGVTTGSCPPDFLKRFISIFYEVIWDTPEFSDMWYGDSQPFVVSNGDPTGFGYHADFINGWHVPTLQSATDNCNSRDGVIGRCPYFNLTTNEVAKNCKIPPSIDEYVSGTLDALPGCNPIQSSPQDAKPQFNCSAPTSIGKPHWPFTDITRSKRFAYVGCGTDLAGQPRTLRGTSSTNSTMTIEGCVDFCTSKGFSVAGLEFSTQCFCDNSIPADRAPTDGLIRDCSMPCAGNKHQVCGGPAVVSLYRKCGNYCANAVFPFINGTAQVESAT